MGYTGNTTFEMKSWNPVGRKLLIGWFFFFCLNFSCLFVLFITVDSVTLYGLAVHFVKVCIKLSREEVGERG